MQQNWYLSIVYCCSLSIILASYSRPISYFVSTAIEEYCYICLPSQLSSFGKQVAIAFRFGLEVLAESGLSSDCYSNYFDLLLIRFYFGWLLIFYLEGQCVQLTMVFLVEIWLLQQVLKNHRHNYLRKLLPNTSIIIIREQIYLVKLLRYCYFFYSLALLIFWELFIFY